MMANKRLLLLSNGSELIGVEPTEFARGAVSDFLGAGVRRVLFVPFAVVKVIEPRRMNLPRKRHNKRSIEITRERAIPSDVG